MTKFKFHASEEVYYEAIVEADNEEAAWNMLDDDSVNFEIVGSDYWDIREVEEISNEI